MPYAFSLLSRRTMFSEFAPRGLCCGSGKASETSGRITAAVEAAPNVPRNDLRDSVIRHPRCARLYLKRPGFSLLQSRILTRGLSHVSLVAIIHSHAPRSSLRRRSRQSQIPAARGLHSPACGGALFLPASRPALDPEDHAGRARGDE